jgi:uncharacterized protein involved in exopolysaccharide biosynthesis
MAQFDAYQYLDHLRERRRWILVTCVTAVVVSLAVSLLLPPKYTATSRIVIEPPAGSDPRAATAVSPVYLESLRTYELFASSDDLFLQAVKHFGLRDRRPIDKLKRSVLKVAIPRNTKIVEISATWTDPNKAHALALYIASETVKLNRSLNREEDSELASEAEKLVAESRARLDKVEEASKRAASSGPVEGLAERLDSLEELKSRLRRELVDTELNVAEYQERENEWVRAELRLSRGRAARLRKQIDELQQEITRTQKLLAERSSRRDQLQAERKGAQAAYEAAENRLRETRSSIGYRGERLKIIDPGIVPERPSSPNIPLNVGAALLIGFAGSLLYLTLELSYRAQKAESLRRSLRVSHRDA